MGVCILAKRVVLELSSSTNFVYSLSQASYRPGSYIFSLSDCYAKATLWTVPVHRPLLVQASLQYRPRLRFLPQGRVQDFPISSDPSDDHSKEQHRQSRAPLQP